MTRHELIRLLERSFIDYPQVPLMSNVAYEYDLYANADIEGLKVLIVEGKPVVVLI